MFPKNPVEYIPSFVAEVKPFKNLSSLPPFLAHATGYRRPRTCVRPWMSEAFLPAVLHPHASPAHTCSELAGQKRSRPSSESGPHEELERTSVLPRISSEDRLQGGSSLDKPSRELPYETGRAALVTGRAARAFPEDLNLNLPGDEFPQQQGTPPPQREYEFWPRPENLQQEYGFRDRLQQQDLGYLVPQDRHAPLDRNAQEQEVGSAAQQDLTTAFARETLDAGGGDARSDRDTGEGDARRTRPGDSKKESLDLDLNSAPLKWL